MKREQLKYQSTEILLERKKKVIVTIRIIILLSLFGLVLFLKSYNITHEITFIHVVITGAMIGAIIESIIKLVSINKVIRERRT